ncbi:PREDICTED: F-box/kelch-repeat protein At3g06240-like [Tarenaya hassleriana]|uniref:F-box/kelch-repeat protein At3g06240-like n=1 Tax=Tarenaya hassleriana TaxID=28532 RepID=UPI00053C97D6|nr:PREDICTED: F-box/kelch-repeat protein At3g06240-like [Tarenaya hassleriana]
MEKAKRARPRDDYDERRGGAPSPEAPCLPPEIIREILLRLPAKSIGRFRCVSKLFRSISLAPEFAKTHLGLSLRNDTFRSGRRRLIVCRRDLYMVDFDSIVDTCDGIEDLDDVEIPESPVMSDLVSSCYQEGYWVQMVGSCNGLVCTTNDNNDVFLFNLTTGESKEIPSLLEFLKSKSKQGRVYVLGLGFDAITNDYKVVALVSGDVQNVTVYSLKTDSWKWVGGSRHGYYGPASGLFFNGAIHWVAKHLEGGRRVVVAFDLTTEQFKDMALPDKAKDSPHGFLQLHTLNGRLCMVYRCNFDYEYNDFWVMNEYGVASSWARVKISEWYMSMKPLCSANKEEETLMELNGELVLYNFRNDTFTSLSVKDAKLRRGFEADTYIESLVSPNSIG